MVIGGEGLQLVRNSLCSSLSPDVSSEKSQECISLQGIHCGRGGSHRFALVTSQRNRRKHPHPLLVQEAERSQ